MRSSTWKDDPGYASFEGLVKRGGIEVLLDGKPIKRAVCADEEQGFVVVLAEKDGAVQMDMVRGELLHNTFFGDVQIKSVPR